MSVIYGIALALLILPLTLVQARSKSQVELRRNGVRTANEEA